MKITLNGVLFPNKRYSAIFSCSYSISSSFETLFNLGSGSQCPSSKHLSNLYYAGLVYLELWGLLLNAYAPLLSS